MGFWIVSCSLKIISHRTRNSSDDIYTPSVRPENLVTDLIGQTQFYLLDITIHKLTHDTTQQMRMWHHDVIVCLSEFECMVTDPNYITSPGSKPKNKRTNEQTCKQTKKAGSCRYTIIHISNKQWNSRGLRSRRVMTAQQGRLCDCTTQSKDSNQPHT